MEKKVNILRIVSLIVLVITAVIAALGLMVAFRQFSVIQMVSSNREAYAQIGDEDLRSALFAVLFLSIPDVLLSIFGLVMGIRAFTITGDMRNERRFPTDDVVRSRLHPLWIPCVVLVILCGVNLILGGLLGGSVIVKLIHWVLFSALFLGIRNVRIAKKDK